MSTVANANLGPAPDSDSIGLSPILGCACSLPFALLFVSLRFYTVRRILRTDFRWDDRLILIASLSSIGYSVCLITLTQYGLGYHISYLRNSGYDLLPFLQILVFPLPFTHYLAVCCTKSSILLFYLRFSISRRFNYCVYFVLFTVVGANFFAACGILFFCRPISYFFDQTSQTGTCISGHVWFAWIIILNCITDAVLLVLPVWIIRPLRVGFAQKAALTAILGTGGLVVAISILRVIIVARGWGNKDFTYRFAINYTWSIIEVNMAIVCACAPCLRGLVGRYVPSLTHLVVRRDPTDIYAIPISQVANRLQQQPAAQPECSGSNTSTTTCVGSSTSGGPCGSKTSVKHREDRTA